MSFTNEEIYELARYYVTMGSLHPLTTTSKLHKRASAFLNDDPMRPVESELRYRIANIILPETDCTLDYPAVLEVGERILNNILMNFELVEKKAENAKNDPNFLEASPPCQHFSLEKPKSVWPCEPWEILGKFSKAYDLEWDDIDELRVLSDIIKVHVQPKDFVRWARELAKEDYQEQVQDHIRADADAEALADQGFEEAGWDIDNIMDQYDE